MSKETATKVRRRKQQGIEILCKQCGKMVNSLGMSAHLQHTCESSLPLDQNEASLPAGTIVGRGTGAPRKLPWTRVKFLEAYPEDTWEEFVPLRNQRVQVLGRVFYLWAGEPQRIPSIVKDVFMDSYKNDQNLLRDATTEQVGVGPLVS